MSSSDDMSTRKISARTFSVNCLKRWINQARPYRTITVIGTVKKLKAIRSTALKWADRKKIIVETHLERGNGSFGVLELTYTGKIYETGGAL